MHVQFSENTPNIARSGPNWLFDIDVLTKLMNSKPIVTGNQANGNVGTKACDDAGKARMEIVPGKDYILLLFWNADPPFSQSSKSSPDAGFKPSRDDEKKVTEEPRKEGGDSIKDRESNDQKDEDNVNNTNTVNAASTNKVNVVGLKTSIELPDDPNMPELEDIVYSDDEDVGTKANMNNLDAFMPVSPIPTTRIHKDHLVAQIIGDLNLAPQTRRMTKNLEEHERSKLDRGYAGRASTIQVTRSLDFAILVAQGYTQEEGIGYDKFFDPVARIEAIRLFLAYATFKDFMVYQMDVKSAFLYGKIEEEVYVCQPPGFEDPEFPDRVYKVEKALYGLHQAPKAWYETLSTYLSDNGFQRGKIDKTLFIKRDKGNILLVQLQVKYVTEILKKFGFTDVKTASTPMETQKLLLKDEDGEEVNVHLYRSMIGSLMYLTFSRPDIMFVVYVCARYHVNPKISHLHAVKRIFSDYAGASLDRKSTTGGINLLLQLKVNAARHNLQLLFADTHNLVAFLAKPAKSEGFEQIVNFLNAHTIKYALMVNPTIYTSCIEQFWATVKMKTVTGEVQLQVLVDGKKIIVTKVSVRREFQLNDEEGTNCLPNATIFEELTRMGVKTTAWNKFSSTMASAIICLAINQKFNFSKYIFESMVKNLDNAGKFLMYPSLERAATTATGLDAEQDRGNINKTQSKATPNEPSSPGTSLSAGPKRQETIGDTISQTRSKNVSKFSNDPLLVRVIDLENTKTGQAHEITSLKLRVKKLEKKGGSRTHKLKRLYKIILVDENQGRYVDDIMFDVSDFTGEEVFVAEQGVSDKDVNLSVNEVTLAQALATLKSAQVQEKANVVEEPSESITTTPTLITTTATTTITVSSTRPRAKGLVIHEQEQASTPIKLSKKDQLKLDKEVAQSLQAEFDEQVRIEREKVKANIAFVGT
ncbi:retrovirus-related pol polyprotein from transposon TNT 1-94 [Tanacetum coccineum]